jgi:hypothetical protein
VLACVAVAGGSIVSRRRSVAGDREATTSGPDLARPSAVAAEPVP